MKLKLNAYFLELYKIILIYFMKFSLLFQVRRAHKTVLPGLSIITAAIANKDSPVTSPQNFKVSPLASHFDHP